MPDLTIAFVDLTGSVSIYETLGNDRASKAVTRLTQWMGCVGLEHGGRVVKTLGDGVMLSFDDNRQALEAVTRLQQEHVRRVAHWPGRIKLMMQAGLARGPVVQLDGDCYGDAVNLASRLSNLAGPEQILATDAVVHGLDGGPGKRSLGAMRIKGRAEPCEVYRIDWQAEVSSDFLTQPAELKALDHSADGLFERLKLTWRDGSRVVHLTDLPLTIGRGTVADVVVKDPRVSRLHVRIDIRSGHFVLEDLSTYGTWVRFDGGQNDVPLRREECLLHSDGIIAMGAPLSESDAPTVRFQRLDV